MKNFYNTVNIEDGAVNFKILAIDGGGTRGILPAAYLNYLQEQLGDTAQIGEHFDLIVGTSTGGIIALAVALRIPIAKILKLYKTGSKEIFQFSYRSLSRGLITPKYGNGRLISELQTLFQEKTIGECKSMVCIPTTDVINGRTVVFKTNHCEEFIHDYKMYAWQAAAATCAAPGFFPVFNDKNLSSYVDGGLWANNPALVGIAEAIKLGYSHSNIKMLSIGTGSRPLFKNKNILRYFGLIAWRTSLVELTFQAQSQSANNIAKYLCGDNYCRIDFHLSSNKFKLDNTSCLDDLEAIAVQRGKETFGKIKTNCFGSVANTSQLSTFRGVTS